MLRKQIVKNKKAIMVEFLLRLIVAIIFLWGAVALGQSFFRITAQGEASLNKLVKTIEETKDGETRSATLTMDRGSMVLYFNKNSEAIGFIRLQENVVNRFFGHGNSIEYIKRPDSCPKDKACACLIQQELKKEEGGYSHTIPALSKDIYDYVGFFSAEKVKKCVGVDKDEVIKEGIYSQSIGEGIIANHIFIGGFFIERKNLGYGNDIRTESYYIQNYKGIIGICQKTTPCITDEAKKEIDKKLTSQAQTS